MRIMILDGHYHLCDQVAHAARVLGHGVTVVRAPSPYREIALADYAREIAAALHTRPDLLLTINAIGLDTGGRISALAHQQGVSQAMWYVDDPTLIVPQLDPATIRRSTMAVWDRTYLPALDAAGARRSLHLPLAADSRVLDHYDVARDAVYIEPVFVGTWSEAREDLLNIAAPDCVIYGDARWAEWPGYRGLLPYGEQLWRAYREHACVINHTQPNAPTACNQRIYDVPACGGRLLTDHRSDIELQFWPDEAQIYDDAYALRECLSARGRLSDRVLRQITIAARDRLREEHTYEPRVAKLIAAATSGGAP
jgi:hypothetical protein